MAAFTSPSDALARWWPTTQSMDLVLGDVRVVAAAVETEVRRFLAGERLRASWERFADLDAAFGAAPDFHNVPTFYLVLPTRSPWTVLWNNSFICSGYDSLSWCLATNQGLTTMHFLAHDRDTTTQAGALFNHRRRVDDRLVERSVYVGKEDARWIFFERGEPLPEEEVASYRARLKRERLNEASLMQLLERLGATPWSESFYALPESDCFVLARETAPDTVLPRARAQVVTGRAGR